MIFSYEIKSNRVFDRKFAKLFKKASRLNLNRIYNTIERIRTNPFEYSLKTHKIEMNKGRLLYSSYVTGDLRIIWEFNSDNISINLLDIGGHSGKRSVYK